MPQTFEDTWFLLNAAELKPLPERVYQTNSQAGFHSAFQYFKDNAHSRFINLRMLGETDKSYLLSRGLSPRYLIANLKKTIRGAYLDALAFQSAAVNRRAVYAFCPFTGKLIKSEHSFLANINVIFYRFQSIGVFYVVVAGLDGFKKNALYFPKEELIVTTGNSWTFEEDDLFELKARVVSNPLLCHKYLTNCNASSKRTAVCIGFFHFAHHLWNELSGLHRLYRENLLRRIDKFLVLREPLGDIQHIFPEIPNIKIEKKSDTSAIFEEILTHNYLAVRVGDYSVAKDLIHRVYRVAKGNCSRTLMSTVKEVRKRYSPLLWVGIRVGSRTWINQVDGLSNVISSLHAEFPRLGVIFDGFSLPADRITGSADDSEYAGILSKENKVVSDIIKRVKQHPEGTPGIFSIIGSSIFEANIWAHAIDVYVSPYGTLQHKVGWFANKPGIIHTNRTVLANPSKYIWAAIDNAIRPHYISDAAVTDIRNLERAVLYRELRDLNESGAGILAAVKRIQEDPDLDNYDVDWEVLLKELLELIRSPRRTAHLDLSVLADRSKKRAKKILQSLTNLFDRSKI
jgi:hypothetical protein